MLISLYSLRIPNAMIAVGSDDNSNITNSKVFICEYNEVSRRWAKTESVTSCAHPVHDMIFAPNMGRSFYLLAVATNNVRILKLKPIVYVLNYKFISEKLVFNFIITL